jgi:hypothetical protein
MTAWHEALTPGMVRVIEERRKAIEKGYTIEHDQADHGDGRLLGWAQTLLWDIRGAESVDEAVAELTRVAQYCVSEVDRLLAERDSTIIGQLSSGKLKVDPDASFPIITSSHSGIRVTQVEEGLGIRSGEYIPCYADSLADCPYTVHESVKGILMHRTGDLT